MYHNFWLVHFNVFKDKVLNNLYKTLAFVLSNRNCHIYAKGSSVLTKKVEMSMSATLGK